MSDPHKVLRYLLGQEEEILELLLDGQYGANDGCHCQATSVGCLLATTTLEEAEDEAFRRTCKHAEVEDGMKILDLGCGWGSLTLWLAEHYKKCRLAIETGRWWWWW